jgi:hypothetical protein
MFSITFPLSTRNYLCFLKHSRFSPACIKPTLCFHRHSRIGRSILKNPFSLSLPGTDCLSASNQEVFQAFRLAWDTIESGLGDRGSIAAKCSRQAMTASLSSTYNSSLCSATCQATGCRCVGPFWDRIPFETSVIPVRNAQRMPHPGRRYESSPTTMWQSAMGLERPTPQ